ncbi:single-strand binding protein/primosomal replication protein n [Scytonema sp. HK-05]|uniref:single-stranded DNA-binding protein n=1 Tax=Scytonema sp. HK-05 TaxID=1137095 RepID=UPI00093628A4|nr:single-stranded DNA-binding protein [Scytonema sp. HK-05]OKH61061.1 single-stranded DNA-binding protein [Scytonema sp. HK-05]BAY46460.1 single-strand binding protein/primosomal replication protein n [Scytonema sp. HK-05]
MNSCILLAEIIQEPQLRFTADNLEVTEMLVQFSSPREGEPPGTLKVVGWGNLAKEIQQNYHQGDRVLLEGRLSMNTIERPEGFKEKRAELTVQKIHSLGTAINTSSSASVVQTQSTTDTSLRREPSSPMPSPVASPAKATPTYESPLPTPTPATNSVGVLPQDDIEEQRKSKNFERSTYPVTPTAEPDPDDIPF